MMQTETRPNGSEWYAVCRAGSTEPLSIFYLSWEQAKTALEDRKRDDPSVYLAKVRWKG
jgi:hypothetical protein